MVILARVAAGERLRAELAVEKRVATVQGHHLKVASYWAIWRCGVKAFQVSIWTGRRREEREGKENVNLLVRRYVCISLSFVLAA